MFTFTAYFDLMVTWYIPSQTLMLDIQVVFGLTQAGMNI